MSFHREMDRRRAPQQTVRRSPLIGTHVNWEVSPSGRWHVEKRRIDSLRSRQTHLDLLKIDEIAETMKHGEPVPAIAISKDGTVLNGHHRLAAAMKVLKQDAIISVLVHEVW